MSFHPRLWSKWLLGQPYTEEMLEEMALCINHNGFRPAVFVVMNTGDSLSLAIGETIASWCKATGFSNSPNQSFADWLGNNIADLTQGNDEGREQVKQLCLDVFPRINIPDWDAARKRLEKNPQQIADAIKNIIAVRNMVRNPDGSPKEYPPL